MRNTGTTLDFDLGDMVGALRNQVEAFSAKEIAPRAAEIDQKNEFPMDLWPKMGALGVLGITVEQECDDRLFVDAARKRVERPSEIVLHLLGLRTEATVGRVK